MNCCICMLTLHYHELHIIIDVLTAYPATIQTWKLLVYDKSKILFISLLHFQYRSLYIPLQLHLSTKKIDRQAVGLVKVMKMMIYL